MNSRTVTMNPFHLVSKIFDLHLPHLASSTLHLQIEFALWICTLLLTSASSLVLYKQSSYMYTSGDLMFLSWVGLWLGRHFIMRLVCTVTWVDPPSGSSVSSSSSGGNTNSNYYGGSWRRRRAFQTWLHRHQQRNSLYHRLRWLQRSLLSPYNLCSNLVKLVQTCAMAGQYCDASAAKGRVSMVGAGGGMGDDHHHHHHSSKSSAHHHHGHQHHALFGPYPQSNHVHTAVILSLARSWGTLCGLLFAIWSLLRGEGGGMRGAVGEVVGLVGGVIWSWTKSCLSLVGLSKSISQSDLLRNGFGSDLSMGSGVGGGNSKRNQRKNKQSGQGGHSGDHSQHHASQHRNATANATGDTDRSLDFLTGKLTFRLFPNAIRSQALHVQQMRTSDMYRALEKVWEASPSSQLVVAMLATIFLISGWLFALGGYTWLLGHGTGTYGVEYQTVESNIPNFKGNPNPNAHLNQPHHNDQITNQGHGYWRNQSPFPAPATFDVQPPSWVSLMFLVISFGTASSLLFYGRVMLPIPEFVAGTNVLKAIRAETGTIGGGGSGGGGSSGGKTSSKLNKDKDLPWAENYKSITTENRLRLYYKVAIIRILENILLCAILPQTEIICRITEHCEPGPLLWGPSGVAGIAGRRFGKGTSFLTSSYDVLTGDDFATRLIITSTVLITAVLLVAQMALTNRTYLAIMGYISGEWELVTDTSDDNTDDHESSSLVSQARFLRPKSWLYDIFGIGSKPSPQSYYSTSRGRSSNTLMQWDPKRRYQKGDRIAYDDAVYEAVSNSPEGPPFDPFLRAAHDLFCDELGHPSSSNMMPCLSMGCVVLASMLLSAMLIWRNAGWNYHPLLLCFAASLVGGYAITHSTERSVHGMKSIANEIAAQIKST
mmetsp:Transcript_1669/g.3559  ORF Transcript_1669/g.3559 Transcript_1669/m.3559 type:complete len:882 (+) Transcript_1669:125-2770(+)